MINSLYEFQHATKQAIENPESFWDDIANEFQWKSPWKQTLSYDFSTPEIKWFVGGKLNITENCLDRHLATQPNKTATTQPKAQVSQTNGPPTEAQPSNRVRMVYVENNKYRTKCAL
ncbi:MAG: acetyl-coenzyme A synthetase N-terminal domain-containing protein, partial [Bacteroidota bacterium]|nr:acetyl-coenzyme A synthetase N-terminal domain-containing protein [Bacteroidota bacterium]